MSDPTVNNNIVIKGTNIAFDFNEIKKRLKDYLSSQNTFADYDFETSGMDILLDVLAYNSQMNAMTAHLSLNELFLDSAQARPNIVSLAKQLGYTPKSVSCSVATLNLSIIPPANYSGSDEVEIAQNTRFDGGGLSWYTTQTVMGEKQSNGRYLFTDVDIREGRRKVVRYYFDARREYPKFEIPDRDVDISTVVVRVRDSESTSVFTTYKPFAAFSEIDATTAVYFIEENALGLYEIYFGSGKFSLAPIAGNIIEIEYIFSNGAAANGIRSFVSNGIVTAPGENISITTVKPGFGGSDKETTESIRFFAPKTFEAQNRCVTLQDYSAVIKEHFPSAETIAVWGGEDETPAEYGRVFISVKPFEGDTISVEQKKSILDNIVKPRQVATITPKIVDPDYTYVGLEVFSRYDSSRTNNDAGTISSIIRDTIYQYDVNRLNKFSNVFRYSNLVTRVDSAENSIQSTHVNVFLVKYVTLNSSSENEIIIRVPGEFDTSDVDDAYIISSSINVANQLCYLKDNIVSSNPFNRRISLAYKNTIGEEKIINNDVGFIDLSENIIYIYGFRPATNTTMKVFINSRSNDITTSKNQILKIDRNELQITVEKDYNRITNSFNTIEKRATPKYSNKFQR